MITYCTSMIVVTMVPSNQLWGVNTGGIFLFKCRGYFEHCSHNLVFICVSLITIIYIQQVCQRVVKPQLSITTTPPHIGVSNTMYWVRNLTLFPLCHACYTEPGLAANICQRWRQGRIQNFSNMG
jgi:hypothetical protein